MKQSIWISAVSLIALTAIGCGSGANTYRVTGRVDLDGEPIKEGRILFRSAGTDGKAFSGPIADGAYAVDVEPGKMRVEITASRLIPGKFDTTNGSKEPVGVMYIPSKYNSRTELNVEVSSSSREHSFPLKSK